MCIIIFLFYSSAKAVVKINYVLTCFEVKRVDQCVGVLVKSCWDMAKGKAILGRQLTYGFYGH